MRKRLLIIIFILLLIIVYCYNNKSIDKSIFKDEEDYSSLPMAVMIETNFNTDQYEVWENSDWPTEEYIFNEEKSGCENGGSLEWNKDTRTMRMNANTSDKCYAYFDSPLKIYTIEDLVNFGISVNEGKTYENEYVLLMNDLDFKNPDSYENSERLDYLDYNNDGTEESLIIELQKGNGFIPIGDSTHSFSGTFNGNNNEIKNFYINNQVETNTGLAFFSSIDRALIENLTVEGNVNSVSTEIAGMFYKAKDSIINHVINKVNVKSQKGSGTIAGLIATLYGNIKILNSSNFGKIEEGGNNGGIIGIITDNVNLKIDNCHNYGEIIQTLGGGYEGGIIAYNKNNTSVIHINNSSNENNIISNNEIEKNLSIGGIIGRNVSQLIIENTYNLGDVQNLKEDYTNGTLNISTGGLIGINTSAVESEKVVVKIINSYNAGNVLGGRRTGGLVGYGSVNSFFIIDKSYNIGEVGSCPTSSQNAGGLIGYVNGESQAYILNSYNAGKVTSYIGAASGLYGRTQVTTSTKNIILNSYNIGDITTITSAANGIFGVVGPTDVTINNVYNIGNLITPKSRLAIGYYASSEGLIDILNTYYLDNVDTASDIQIDSKQMPQEQMRNQSFVNTLNANLTNINLEEIDPLLKDYTLLKWIQGPDGYPIFEYQKK